MRNLLQRSGGGFYSPRRARSRPLLASDSDARDAGCAAVLGEEKHELASWRWWAGPSSWAGCDGEMERRWARRKTGWFATRLRPGFTKIQKKKKGNERVGKEREIEKDKREYFAKIIYKLYFEIKIVFPKLPNI